MTTDALDLGPDGDFPCAPRNPDGTLDTARMPVGLRHQVATTLQEGPDGKVRQRRHAVLLDVEPTVGDGRRISDVIPLPPDDQP